MKSQAKAKHKAAKAQQQQAKSVPSKSRSSLSSTASDDSASFHDVSSGNSVDDVLPIMMGNSGSGGGAGSGPGAAGDLSSDGRLIMGGAMSEEEARRIIQGR